MYLIPIWSSSVSLRSYSSLFLLEIREKGIWIKRVVVCVFLDHKSMQQPEGGVFCTSQKRNYVQMSWIPPPY